METGGASLTRRQAILGHASAALADSAYLRDGPDWRGRREAVESIPLREWFGLHPEAVQGRFVAEPHGDHAAPIA